MQAHSVHAWGSCSTVRVSGQPHPIFTSVQSRSRSIPKRYSRGELLDVLRWADFEPLDGRMFDLTAGGHSNSFRGRILYDGLYPVIAHAFPNLRGYIWISEQPPLAKETVADGRKPASFVGSALSLAMRDSTCGTAALSGAKTRIGA